MNRLDRIKSFQIPSWAFLLCLNVCRFLASFTFIFSGFVKAIDPKGTVYKLESYLNAFLNWEIQGKGWDILLMFSVLLASFEFLLGIYLFWGIRRNFTTISMLFLMGIFVPLSLVLALTNLVHDCGCFGDVVTLTNIQTFFKNLILLLMVVFLFCCRKRMTPLVPISVHWAYSMYSMLFIVICCLIGILYLPLIDFRPYKVGTDIAAGMVMPEGKEGPLYENIYVLEKNGERKEFALDEYPDSTWTFVSVKQILKSKGYEPPTSDFIVSNQDGEDVTDLILSDTSYVFLIVSPHFENADKGSMDALNTIYDYCQDTGYSIYGLSASGESAINRWRYETGASYPVFVADEILLKTIIRSNPGLVLLKKGVVVNKWSNHGLPLPSADNRDAILELPYILSAEGSTEILLKMVLSYVIPLLFITLALNLRKFNRNAKLLTKNQNKI